MTLAPPIRWLQPSPESTGAREHAHPGDWSGLPAIEPTSGALELTAPTRQFVDGLRVGHHPGMTLEPLGHGPGLDAPRGLVRGIARVLDGGRRDGPELTAAPRTRSRRRPAGAPSAPETEVLVESSPTHDDAQPPVATPSSTPTAQAAGKAPARSSRPGKDIAAASPLPDVLRRAIRAVPAPAAPTDERPTPAPLTWVTAEVVPPAPAGVVSAPRPRRPPNPGAPAAQMVARTEPQPDAANPDAADKEPTGPHAVSALAVSSALGVFRPRRTRGAFRQAPLQAAAEEPSAATDVPVPDATVDATPAPAAVDSHVSAAVRDLEPPAPHEVGESALVPTTSSPETAFGGRSADGARGRSRNARRCPRRRVTDVRRRALSHRSPRRDPGRLRRRDRRAPKCRQRPNAGAQAGAGSPSVRPERPALS